MIILSLIKVFWAFKIEKTFKLLEVTLKVLFKIWIDFALFMIILDSSETSLFLNILFSAAQNVNVEFEKVFLNIWIFEALIEVMLAFTKLIPYIFEFEALSPNIMEADT